MPADVPLAGILFYSSIGGLRLVVLRGILGTWIGFSGAILVFDRVLYYPVDFIPCFGDNP